MVYVSCLSPWAPSGVCRVVIWFACVHWAFWGFTWTMKRTFWPALGSVTVALKAICWLVQPSVCVESAWDWSDDAAWLPVWATSVGALGGTPKSGGVNSSPYV